MVGEVGYLILSAPVQSCSENSLLRRCGSIRKLCIPAPYCPCMLVLLALQIMSCGKGITVNSVG